MEFHEEELATMNRALAAKKRQIEVAEERLSEIQVKLMVGKLKSIIATERPIEIESAMSDAWNYALLMTDEQNKNLDELRKEYGRAVQAIISKKIYL